MLSRTSEYALRAMVYLAQNANDWPIPGRKIADDIGIPSKYLSNILRELVRRGVLQAVPGNSGGFRMARDPKSIQLEEGADPFCVGFGGDPKVPIRQRRVQRRRPLR